jgi:hypothetical protein
MSGLASSGGVTVNGRVTALLDLGRELSIRHMP